MTCYGAIRLDLDYLNITRIISLKLGMLKYFSDMFKLQRRRSPSAYVKADKRRIGLDTVKHV